MAISTDRLSISNLTDIPVNNYTSASDTSSINATRSLSEAYTQSGLSNALSPNISIGNQSLQSTMGIFGNNCNQSSMSAQQRSNYYNSRDSRNMGYGGSTLCSNGRTANGLDGVLGNISNINNFNNVKVSIPSFSAYNVTNAITNTVTNLFGGTIGGLVGIPLCLLAAVTDGLIKALNKIGSTLANKLSLSNLFNAKLTQCLSKAISGMVSNSTLNRTTTGSVINQFSNTGNNTSSAMIDSMLSNGTSRSTLYDGFGYAFNTENDSNVESKLSLYNSVISTDTDPDSVSLSQSYTKGSVENIISNLNNTENTNTTYGTADYENVVTGLHNVDSGWNKDSTGETNYYRASGNSRLASLSETSVLGNTETNTSGTYTTNLSEAESIYLVNSVA